MAGQPSPALASFERMLAAGRDGALLRFSLGNEYLKTGDAGRAAPHLAQAVALDPDYTAAWKLLGRALAENGQPTEALAEPELSPAKPARRKKAIPIEPMALPVAEPAPARRRRAKAA